MIDAHMKGEIEAFYGDIKSTNEILKYEQQNFAMMLKSGLGNKIKERLENPPKPNYFKGLKLKLKRWLNKKKWV